MNLFQLYYFQIKKLVIHQQIFILCVLGSFVRLWYAYQFKPWEQAPDQIAWELIIEQHNFSYASLIYYPHEGGTIFISLLCFLIEPFTDFSSLSLSALLLDFCVRFLQIKIVKEVLGIKTARLFGIWSVFAAPCIIPWASLNFGLHYLSSVFPFILIYLLFREKNTVKYHFVYGIFLGLSFWFSYSNAILIPIFFLYKMATKTTIKNILFSSLSLSIILITHWLVRKFADSGFHLQEFELYSIRGTNFSLNEIDIANQLSLFIKTISNSFIALPYSNQYTNTARNVNYLFLLIALVGFIISIIKKTISKSCFILMPVIILYILIYVFSPFFSPEDVGNHVLFRHSTYILSSVSLFIILGLLKWRWNFILLSVFFTIGIFRSVQLFSNEELKKNELVTKASGWVLGKKFGHNTEMLRSILESNPENSKLLSQGIGWGISTALFERSTLSEKETNKKVEQLIQIIRNFPEIYKRDLNEGIKFSFSNEVTPLLDKNFLLKYENNSKTSY